MDALYTSALKGKGAMPPKGGNGALPDADVKAAVDYLTGLASKRAGLTSNMGAAFAAPFLSP